MGCDCVHVQVWVLVHAGFCHCVLHLVKQAVDRFNALTVTAFVTPGNARFLMLHDGKPDDAIKASLRLCVQALFLCRGFSLVLCQLVVLLTLAHRGQGCVSDKLAALQL
jgi:hypothetical protein